MDKETMKRELFLNNIKAYIENGLVEEVFHNEIVSILNFADTVYVVTNYSKSKSSNNYYGLILDKDTMDFISDDNINYYYIVRGLKEERFKRQYVVFNEQTFNRLIEYKKQTMKNGPSRYIDKELENKWKEMMSVKKGVR